MITLKRGKEIKSRNPLIAKCVSLQKRSSGIWARRTRFHKAMEIEWSQTVWSRAEYENVLGRGTAFHKLTMALTPNQQNPEEPKLVRGTLSTRTLRCTKKKGRRCNVQVSWITLLLSVCNCNVKSGIRAVTRTEQQSNMYKLYRDTFETCTWYSASSSAQSFSFLSDLIFPLVFLYPPTALR